MTVPKSVSRETGSALAPAQSRWRRGVTSTRRALTVAAVAGASLALAACGGSDSDQASTAGSAGGDAPDGPIVIGAATSETGALAAFDAPALTAAKLAIEEINEAGGLLGRQVEIVTADTKSQTTLGPQAAQEVISQGAQALLVSCDFDFGSPAASVGQSKGLVSMSLCAGSPKFGPSGIGPLAYTSGTPAATEGAVLAEWAYNEKGWKTAYSLVDNELVYDKEFIEGFERRWKDLAGPDALLGHDEFQQADQSIASQVTRLKGLSKQPDFVAFCSRPPGGATAVRELRGAGITLPILSCLGMGPSEWIPGISGLKDMFVTGYGSYTGDDDRAEINELREAMIDETGEAPKSSFYIAGYAAMQLLAEAIEKAGSVDGEAMAKVMDTFDGVDTLAGATTFTPEQHISFERPLAIFEVRDGGYKFVTRYQPSEVPR